MLIALVNSPYSNRRLHFFFNIGTSCKVQYYINHSSRIFVDTEPRSERDRREGGEREREKCFIRNYRRYPLANLIWHQWDGSAV